MRNYGDIVKQVIDTRKKMNDKSLSKTDTLLPLWVAWYAGYYEKFHHYYTYNGNEKCWHYKKTLKMWKRVCEDWASLLMSEKVDVVVDDNELLHDLLNDVGFWIKCNRATEIGFALGHAGVAVDLENISVTESGEVIKSDKTKVKLSYFNALKTVPITFEDGEVTEVAFVTEKKDCLYINMHIKDDDGNYHVVLYRESKLANGKKAEEITDIATNYDKPLFAIIKPNIENNLFINSPYPLSICANAIDVMQSIDNKYDSLDNEIMLGRKRVYISTELTQITYNVDTSSGDSVTKTVDTFDPNDTLIYALPTSKALGDDKPMLFSPSDPLRVADLTSAINFDLKMLSNKVGLGNDYYNFEKGSVITATQVISEKSDTFRNLKKHELLLEKSLQTIVMALIYCNNEYTTNPEIKMEVPRIIFDDSIIEDKASEQKNDLTNLQNGSMSLVEYRMKWFGEDEDKAREKIYEINGRTDLIKRLNSYMLALQSGLMTPKMFVNLAYTDEDLKAAKTTREELIAEIGGVASPQHTLSQDEIMAAGEYDPNKNEQDESQDKLDENQSTED